MFEKPADVKRLKSLLEQIHEVFITHVKTRRAGKLDEKQELFGGEIRVGQQAVDAGLADATGHLQPVMKQRFGDNVRFRPYGIKRGILSRFGAGAASGAVAALEERAEFARFGL